MVEFEGVGGDSLHPGHHPFLSQFSDVRLDLNNSPLERSRSLSSLTWEASLGLVSLAVITQVTVHSLVFLYTFTRVSSSIVIITIIIIIVIFIIIIITVAIVIV